VRQTDSSIFSDTLRYSSSNLCKQLLGVVATFLRPRLLTAHEFGLWCLLALIPFYSEHLHFGSLSSLRLRLAELRNRGRRAASLRTTTFLGSLVPNLVLAAGLLIAALVCSDGQLRTGLLLSIPIVLLSWWLGYEYVLLKAELDFKLISRTNYLRALVLFLLTIILLPLFGFTGALVAVLLALAAACGFVFRLRPTRTRGRFDWQEYLALLREGFPLLGIDMMVLLARTADRLVIAAMIGTAEVGIYAIGGMIIGFLMNVPGAAREVTEPRLMQDFDSLPYGDFIEEYYCRPLFHSALLVPLITGSCWLVLPVFIRIVLPQYSAALAPARVLVLSSYFLALYLPMRGLMFSHGWQDRSLLTAMAVLLANLVGNVLVIRLGSGLTGVALVSGATFFLLFVSENLLTLRRFRNSLALSPGRRFYLGLLSFPLSLCLLLVLEHWVGGGRNGELLISGLRLLLFVLCWMAFLALAWWPLHRNHLVGRNR